MGIQANEYLVNQLFIPSVWDFLFILFLFFKEIFSVLALHLEIAL